MAELESGKYRPVGGYLRWDVDIFRELNPDEEQWEDPGDFDVTEADAVGYCCLGVLAEMVGYGKYTLCREGYWPEYGDDPDFLHREVGMKNSPEWLTYDDAVDFANYNDTHEQFPIEMIKERYGID